MGSKIDAAPGIVVRILTVLTAIHFYSQVLFHTCEIQNIWTYRMLPSELESP